MQGNSTYILPLLLLPWGFFGCDTPEASKHLDRISSHVGQNINEAQQLAEGEVQKLFAWEYHVVELPDELSREDLAARLNELGSDRWDCFHMSSSGVNLRLVCKRQPKSYLKYIPRVF